MPKGKKFNAAEKHFANEQARLWKRIKGLEDHIFLLERENQKLKNELFQLQEENNAFAAENKVLRQMTPLSNDDVKELVQRARSMNMVTSLLKRSFTMGVTSE